MAQALPQPTMDTLAGVDARLQALDKLEALVNEVVREKTRHRSNVAAQARPSAPGAGATSSRPANGR